MNKGLENLLTQINNLESQNRLINIGIEELKVHEEELQKKEKELVSEIEKLTRQLKCMVKEENDLNNDIARVDLICKNVEATLHNEFMKVEMSAQKINQVGEYIEESDKKIKADLQNANDKVLECLQSLNDSDVELTTLKKIRDDHYLLSQITLEELYEIYEDTQEKYQENSFKKQCDKIVMIDYKNHAYFCNPTHLLHMINLLTEKIKRSNGNAPFNFFCIANYFGVAEEPIYEERESFGLSELNKLMINHYKSKQIQVNSNCI